MRFESMTRAAAVCLFAGLIVPGYAQHDDKQGEKQGGKQSQGHAQQGKPQQQERGSQAQQAPQQRRSEQPQQQQRTQAPQQQLQAQPQQRVHETQPRQQPERAQQAPQQQRAQAPQQRAQQQQQQQRSQQERQQPAQQRSILSQTQQQPERSRQQAQSWQQQRGWLKQGGGWQGHDNFQQDSSRNWNSDHRTWSQRGGYGGYYIPQYSFNLYFGSQHFFRFRTAPVMYLGYPRFEYQGISFLLLDPWPANWSQDWYEADDVYIDYAGDGYYLYNRDYPHQRLAITILV